LRGSCIGDDAGAHAYLDEAIPIVRRSNDRAALARLNAIRAELLFKDADAAGALACVREAETIYRERRHEMWLCITLLNAAAYLLELRNFGEAWTAAREALDIGIARDESYLIAPALGHIARIAAEGGNPEEAARLLGFVDASYAAAGNVREPTEQKGYEALIDVLHAALSPERVDALLAQGREMNREAAVAEARALPSPV
jgi:hypothetical protein